MNLHGRLISKDASNATEIAAENRKLRQTIDDLSSRCEKLENSGKDMERLLREQSDLMKALNVRKYFYILIARCVISSLLILCNEVVH